jgi:hypothetical protein
LKPGFHSGNSNDSTAKFRRYITARAVVNKKATTSAMIRSQKKAEEENNGHDTAEGEGFAARGTARANAAND